MGKIIRNGVDYGGSYTLPPASANTLGGVKIGNGLSVTSDGTLSTTGGGGGGSLTGEIKTYDSRFLGDSSEPILPSSMVTSVALGSIPLNFVDVYECTNTSVDTDQLVTDLVNVRDSSDTTSITIPTLIDISPSDIPKRLYRNGDAVTIIDGSIPVQFEGTIYIRFQVGGVRYSAAGEGLVSIGWDDTTGILEACDIDLEIKTISDVTNRKTYKLSDGGTITYSHQIESTTLGWKGYYVG